MQTEIIHQEQYAAIQVFCDKDSISINQGNTNASDDAVLLDSPSALILAAAINRLVPAEHNDIYNHKDMD